MVEILNFVQDDKNTSLAMTFRNLKVITWSMKEINFHPPNLSLKGEGITG
jgi:hypothetical protein